MIGAKVDHRVLAESAAEKARTGLAVIWNKLFREENEDGLEVNQLMQNMVLYMNPQFREMVPAELASRNSSDALRT